MHFLFSNAYTIFAKNRSQFLDSEFSAHELIGAPRMQLEMPKPWTVRPDGLTSVRPDGLTSRKYRQKHKIFVKVGSQFCQILNSYSRNG